VYNVQYAAAAEPAKKHDTRARCRGDWHPSRQKRFSYFEIEFKISALCSYVSESVCRNLYTFRCMVEYCSKKLSMALSRQNKHLPPNDFSGHTSSPNALPPTFPAQHQTNTKHQHPNKTKTKTKDKQQAKQWTAKTFTELSNWYGLSVSLSMIIFFDIVL